MAKKKVLNENKKGALYKLHYQRISRTPRDGEKRRKDRHQGMSYLFIKTRLFKIVFQHDHR